VSRYQKGKTNRDFTEARDSEWQWRQLGRMQVCTSLQRDNHASTPPLSFLQAGCPSCRPANSVKALKAQSRLSHTVRKFEYLQKLSYFPLGLCPKLRTLKILPQVDRVVNEIRRGRRRRWSLLATPTAVGLYDSRRVVAVYYKSINCNPRTPLLLFVVDFCRATCFCS